MNERIKCHKCGREEPAFDYAHVCGPVEVKKSFSKLLKQFEKESKLEIFGLGAKRDKWEDALEKYAELIVKECVELCETAAYAPRPALNPTPVEQYAFIIGEGNMAVNLAKQIRKHFGVKE